MLRLFSQIDVLLVPSVRDEMLTISNFTSHPSLTFRGGFVEVVKRAAIGRPIRIILYPVFRRRAVYPMALHYWVGSSTKELWRALSPPVQFVD